MKDKKGFTLVELLSTIAILAVILGIASASYIGIKRHIRRSYYNTLEESILVSGGEYFSYTTDKPNIFGDEKKISLEKLVEGKYITEVIDQKGKSCNLSGSYVTAYKNSSDKSDYYVCLKCPEDDYPNDKDNINKVCSGEVTYGLRMVATIGNTSKLYSEGEYINQDVKLTFQTYNDVTDIEVKKDNKVVDKCTMTDKNGLKSCSIKIDTSGKYEYYGYNKNNNNQTKSGTIDILIDNVKPEFNVYDDESLINKKEVLKSTESNNTSIIVNVKNIKDLNSGVKTIKYTFDSNYTNIDRTKEEFKIEKKLNLGKTNLKIKVEDYAGNINTRVITYEVYKKTAKPDTAYCNTLTYNGNNQTLTKTGDNFTFSNNVKKNAGTYEVVAKLNENYRWQDDKNDDIKINCSIDKKSIAVTWNNPTLTYNGANQGPTPSAISGVTGETINLTRTTSKNAGNYTSTATCSKVTGGSATCNNYTFTNTTKDFTINKATPTITLSAASGSVNAGSSITFTEKANVAGSFGNVSGTTGVAKVSPASYKGVAANTAKTVTVTGVSNGNSTITITFTPTDKTNYNTKTATYTVKGYKVASLGSCNTLTYNGTSQTLAANGTGVSYTNNSGTNATSYTVTVAVINGYRFSDNTTSKTLSCSIAKKTVAVTWTAGTYTYNGSDQGPTPSAISGVTGETINLTRTTSKNAGNYTSTATCSKVTGGSATCNNYTFTNTTKDFTINKATPTITLSAASGSVNAGSSITFTEKANVAGSFGNVSGTTGVAKVSPASYKGVAANTAKTVTVTGVSNGNSTITITFTPTDKTNYNTKTATYTVKGYKVASLGSCNTLTYNGTSQTLAANGTGVSYTNNSGTNATSYTVTVAVINGYRFSDNTTSKTLSCSIAKRKITIKANDQKITTSVSSLPSDVTVTNLASGDTLSSIKLTESGGSETGNIIPSNAVIVRGTNTVTSNYNITYKNGTYKRDTKICANIYINGASKIGTSTSDKELCCNSTNGSSCAITLPSITPKSGFTALGYSDDGDALTSASYQANQSVTIYKPTSDDEKLPSYYAITRSTTRNTYNVTFDLNGATSYTTGGSTYTASKTFSCNADYAYNGDELPDECGITLPTITRSGFTIHGWAEDSNKQSATYQVNQVITLHDDIDLFAITSKSVTLKYNTNSTTTVTTDNLTSKKETKTMFNTDGVMFNIPSYNDGKVCRNTGGDKYHGYKLLGLSSNQSGNNVEFCFGDQIYLESDKTLFLVWQDKYATAVGNVSGNLILRAGAGKSNDKLASIKKGDPVYIQSAKYKWNSSDKHTWYPVIYGSKIGWAAGNTSNNSTLKNLKLTSTPNADSCEYAYSCTSNNKLLSITPSDVVLNITSNTSKQKMQQTLSIANQCGPMTEATSSNSSLVTATTSGVVKAVSGSVAVNQTKSAVVTFSTKYGCSEKVNVLVKNTEATAPDITISVSGDSSTCSGSYIKGATATVTCRSDLPITSYSATIGSTSYTETTSGNTKTSTISLSSTGSKTINVTCSNAEGTSTASKSVSIKVKNASSSCGCSTHYSASTAGTTCSRCKSWSLYINSVSYLNSKKSTSCRYNAASKAFYKDTYSNWQEMSGGKYKWKVDTPTYKCTLFACKTYKTCCHT